MTNNRRRIAGLAVALTLATGGFVALNTQASNGLAPASGATTLTNEQAATLASELTFAREEERMARDLYATLADHYAAALPFSRITRSEQQHFDSVGLLLTRYGVPDPAANKTAGTYADPAIQKLYDGWLAQGLTSLKAAYDVGTALEQRDIADLKDTLAKSTATDVDQVFSRLLTASEHHLAAFQAAKAGTLADFGAGMGQQGRIEGRGTDRGMGMSQDRGEHMGHGRGQDMGQGMGTGSPWNN